jgi:hypothetical protein
VSLPVAPGFSRTRLAACVVGRIDVSVQRGQPGAVAGHVIRSVLHGQNRDFASQSCREEGGLRPVADGEATTGVEGPGLSSRGGRAGDAGSGSYSGGRLRPCPPLRCAYIRRSPRFGTLG